MLLGQLLPEDQKTCQRHHQNGSHTVAGEHDHAGQMSQCLQHKQRGQKVGNTQQYTVCQFPDAHTLFLINHQTQAKQQCGNEGKQQENVFDGGIAINLIDFGHHISHAADAQHQQKHPAAAAKRSAFGVIDNDNGDHSQYKSRCLQRCGQFPEPDNGQYHGNQNAQLHKDGGQYYAVVAGTPLHQGKAAQINETVDRTQTYGKGKSR